MIFAVSILTFLAVGCFVYWLASGKDAAARRRIEKDLIRRGLSGMPGAGDTDESALLKDEALSGFGPLDAFLNSIKLAANLRKLIVQADLPIRVGTLLLLMGVLAGSGLCAGLWAHLGWPISVVLGLLLGWLPYTYVLICRKRRIARFEAQFPEAVDLMSRAIRAGHAFSTGIKMVADEMPDPVGKEFRRVFEEQNLGLPMRSALMGLLERIELVDLKLFVVAVMIQRQSGGNLSEILDKIAYTIRERFRVLRQLRVHTAQARLTGIILTALPPVVGSLIYALNYEYIKVIFLETWGLYILATSLLLQILGFLWIRKIVNIEV
ncbi:MAG TPA: type II secretion system F family protein [Candidatus Polarisedimenticolia bacterium]|nr:type II secretion system F family protein [Candidatus Polarisedimenticolia bacterium]